LAVKAKKHGNVGWKNIDVIHCDKFVLRNNSIFLKKVTYDPITLGCASGVMAHT
jgi:hypothetical protein